MNRRRAARNPLRRPPAPWVLPVLLAALPICAASNDDEALQELIEASRPQIDISVLPRPPVLEEFLGMTAPADLLPHLTRVRGFVQQQPEDGSPASQSTDVYLGYDATHFDAIFVAFDEEPEKMRANLGRHGELQRRPAGDLPGQPLDRDRRGLGLQRELPESGVGGRPVGQHAPPRRWRLSERCTTGLRQGPYLFRF